MNNTSEEKQDPQGVNQDADQQQQQQPCSSTLHKWSLMLKRHCVPVIGFAIVMGFPTIRDYIVSKGKNSGKKRSHQKSLMRAAKKNGGIVEAYPEVPEWIRQNSQVTGNQVNDGVSGCIEHFVDAVLCAVGLPSLPQLRSGSNGGDDEGSEGNDVLSTAGLTICYTFVLLGVAKYLAWQRRQYPSGVIKGGPKVTELPLDMVTGHQRPDYVKRSSTQKKEEEEETFNDDDVGAQYYRREEEKRRSQEQQGDPNKNETHAATGEHQADEVAPFEGRSISTKSGTSNTTAAAAEEAVETTDDDEQDDDALCSGYINTGRMSTASSEPTHGSRVRDAGRQTPRTSMLRTVDSAAKSNQRLFESVQKQNELEGMSNHNGDASTPLEERTPQPLEFTSPEPTLPAAAASDSTSTKNDVVNMQRFHTNNNSASATLPSNNGTSLTRDDLRSMPPNMRPPTPPTNALRSVSAEHAPLERTTENALESTPILSPQSPQIFVSGLVSLALALPTQTPADVAALASASVKYSCKEVLLVEPSVGPGSKTSESVNDIIRKSAANFKIFKSIGTGEHSGATVMMSYIHDDDDQVCVAIHRKRFTSPASPSPTPRLSRKLMAEDNNEEEKSADRNGDDDDDDNVINRDGLRDGADEEDVPPTPRDSIRLYDFTHPKNAIYFFDASPVDHESEANHLSFCGVHVHLSDDDDQAFTSLSAIVNITLYDRSMKLKRRNNGPWSPQQLKVLKESPYGNHH